MRVGLLGELEITADDGTHLTVSGAKLRALLAILALDAGRPVAAEQLVDALWGDEPPPNVKNGLQGLVSKLRRALGSTDVVAMRGGGYVLDVERDAVDVHRFERLVAEGLHAEALALWRGDALAEFAYEDFAATTITRLTELRLVTIEERIDAELAAGAHHAAIADLESLVAEHPLRERLRGLLMLALYRAGRQADALRVFQDGRRVLAEELGLDPGPELRALESAILAQDAALDAPAVAPAPARRRALPEPLTPLLGRADVVDELTALLAEHRLVTLVGPGGVGKTRLALEVGRTAAAAMADGACLVELAPYGDPADVRTAVAAALDLPDPNRLAELLGDRRLLLVLDNCEHVIAEAATVAEELLARCPGLVVLATSREGLRIAGEVVWPVPPLAAAAAVELFVARAGAAGARLDEDRTAIEDICARLDGLPLAIELAAARTRAFSIEQVASRLHDRFRLLTGGSRTALPRQQTLRAVVDWSYELLFEDEQRVFERLSVFPGGCDLATATEVCAGDDLPAADLEELVLALVEKSLVVADGERFKQLQTLAQYGREKLAERGDAERVRNAMAAHLAALCSRSAHAFTGDHQREWLATMDRERENLRAALEWAVDTGDAETAMTIAGGASWPNWLAGTLVEGRRWVDAAFALDGEVTGVTRALGLTGRGVLAFQSGIREGVDDDLGAALDIFRSIGDQWSVVYTSTFWAEVAAARGDVEEGRRRRAELLALYDTMPDAPIVDVGRAYSSAKLAQLDADLDGAERWYREAADGLTRIDRPVMRSMTLGMVAEFEERAGRHAAAAEALDEAVELCEAVGMRGFMGAVQSRLGWALLHIGDLARAEDVYERALEHARRVGDVLVTMRCLAGLAVVHHLRGRREDALTAAADALALHDVIGPRRMANRLRPHAEQAVAAATACLVLAAYEDDIDAAQPLLDRARGLLTSADAPVPPFLSTVAS